MFMLNHISNTLTLVISLLTLITFFTFHFYLYFLSIYRLRIIFIPFFLILFIFRFFVGISSINDNDVFELFDNTYLILHIITSLLAYSLITISLATSFCLYSGKIH